MANIIITSTTNSIKVDFGTYDTIKNLEKGTWRLDKIRNFQLAKDNDFVIANIEGEPQWTLVYSASGNHLIVDTVGGASPSSNSDLYDKLVALIT